MGTYQGNEFTRNFSGKTRPQSSQLAEPLLTDPGLKSGIGARELFPLKSIYLQTTKTTPKPRQAGNDSSNLPSQILACEVKRHHHHDDNYYCTVFKVMP